MKSHCRIGIPAASHNPDHLAARDAAEAIAPGGGLHHAVAHAEEIGRVAACDEARGSSISASSAPASRPASARGSRSTGCANSAPCRTNPAACTAPPRSNRVSPSTPPAPCIPPRSPGRRRPMRLPRVLVRRAIFPARDHQPDMHAVMHLVRPARRLQRLDQRLRASCRYPDRSLRAPANSRRKCSSGDGSRPLISRSPSHTPSPAMKPPSNTDTIASPRGTRRAVHPHLHRGIAKRR